MKDNLEKILSKRPIKDKLISSLNNDITLFNEAKKLALTNKKNVSWRAAWVLFHSIEKNDTRLKSSIKEILFSIKDKKDGHQRELLKIIEKFDLDNELEGYLFDECMNIWESIRKQPSVRIIAFKLLMKTVRNYPEMVGELEYLIEEEYTESLSPGIKNSIYRMKKELLEIPGKPSE